MWVIEKTDDGVTKIISAWALENEARKHACYCATYTLSYYWDLTDPTVQIYVKDINDAVKHAEYELALSYYTRYENLFNSKNPILYHVLDEPIRTIANDPIIIMFPTIPSPAINPSVVVPVPESPFVAMMPGATCRGPCTNFSPDAYADKKDLTFLCYQCKLMSKAFGNPIK